MAKAALNRKAKFNYELGESLEAGIILSGAEIKAARAGQISLEDSFVQIREGEAFLVNMHIGAYAKSQEQGESRRTRKLLLNKREIEYLNGKVAGSNLTIVPTRLYFKHNYAKIEVALGVGKKKWDKREALKKKAISRDAENLLRAEKHNFQKEHLKN